MMKPKPPGWPTLDPAALYGLPGEVVGTLAPHTEADPVALCADYLVSFGNAVNAGPHFQVGAVRHYPREYMVATGRTSKARKGTARAEIREVMTYADPEWSQHHVVTGIASGEGLIHAVRDPVGEDDPGVTDKRVLAIESEFSRLLAVAGREGSIVSAVCRDAWDTGNLGNLTKNNPSKATNAHISIEGQITIEELTRRLTDTEIANGMGARFLFLLVDRSQVLPSGGSLQPEDYEKLGRKTQQALETSRRFGRLCRSPEAEELWRFLYGIIAEQDEGGIVGSIMARADAHLLRLGLIYALADSSRVVEVEHLEAAWALLCYADDSARYIFGGALGDPIADGIPAALKKLPEGQGLDGTQQRDLFGRHASGRQLEAARARLAELGLVENLKAETEGRPRTVTFLRCDESDLSDRSRDMSLKSLRSQAEKPAQ
jgi:hypothetical protein